MRTRTMLSLLLPSALACSGSGPSPTEVKPEFIGGCQTIPTLTATPPTATVAPQTAAQATFLAKSNCTTIAVWTMSPSRTGAVASTGAANPVNLTLNAGESKNVLVPYTTGSPGTGTVVVTASGGSPTISTSASLFVTVGSAAAGVPFGPSDLFLNSTTLRQAAPFTWTTDFVDPSYIITQINTARINHIKFGLVMTGGSHSNYITNAKFDITKWKTRQNAFNTQPIKDAVAAGVADGTIPFAVLMDEPNHSSWGGVMTHAVLDDMSRFTKAIFPTLRTDVDVTYTWQSTSVYQSVDVMTTQYTARQGDVNNYRTSALNSAATQKVAVFFSLNILNGGTDLRSTGCPTPQTGGLGTTENGVLKGCRMTSAQVQSFGDALLAAPEACGLKMWRWDDAFMAVSANQTAFNHVATTAAGHAAKPCVKPL